MRSIYFALLACICGCSTSVHKTTNRQSSNADAISHGEKAAQKRAEPKYVVMLADRIVEHPLTMTMVSNARRDYSRWYEVYFENQQVAVILNGAETLESLAQTLIMDTMPERYTGTKVTHRQDIVAVETMIYRKSKVFALSEAALTVLKKRVDDYVGKRRLQKAAKKSLETTPVDGPAPKMQTLKDLVQADGLAIPFQHPLVCGKNGDFPLGTEQVFIQLGSKEVVHAVFPKGVKPPPKNNDGIVLYGSNRITLHGHYQKLRKRSGYSLKKPPKDYTYFVVTRWEKKQ